MIHGTTVAMMVGVVSMSVALLLGLFFGSLAGYFGDTRLKVTRLTLILNVVFFPFVLFYAFAVRSYTLSDSMSISVFVFLGNMILSLGIFAGIMSIPKFTQQIFR
jgi:ABC-type dipeptide/oligopeptide/nickel transport system permease subunit